MAKYKQKRSVEVVPEWGPSSYSSPSAMRGQKLSRGVAGLPAQDLGPLSPVGPNIDWNSPRQSRDLVSPLRSRPDILAGVPEDISLRVNPTPQRGVRGNPPVPTRVPWQAGIPTPTGDEVDYWVSKTMQEWSPGALSGSKQIEKVIALNPDIPEDLHGLVKEGILREMKFGAETSIAPKDVRALPGLIDPERKLVSRVSPGMRQSLVEYEKMPAVGMAVDNPLDYGIDPEDLVLDTRKDSPTKGKMIYEGHPYQDFKRFTGKEVMRGKEAARVSLDSLPNPRRELAPGVAARRRLLPEELPAGWGEAEGKFPRRNRKTRRPAVAADVSGGSLDPVVAIRRAKAAQAAEIGWAPIPDVSLKTGDFGGTGPAPGTDRVPFEEYKGYGPATLSEKQRRKMMKGDRTFEKEMATGLEKELDRRGERTAEEMLGQRATNRPLAVKRTGGGIPWEPGMQDPEMGWAENRRTTIPWDQKLPMREGSLTPEEIQVLRDAPLSGEGTNEILDRMSERAWEKENLGLPQRTMREAKDAATRKARDFSQLGDGLWEVARREGYEKGGKVSSIVGKQAAKAAKNANKAASLIAAGELEAGFGLGMKAVETAKKLQQGAQEAGPLFDVLREVATVAAKVPKWLRP